MAAQKRCLVVAKSCEERRRKAAKRRGLSQPQPSGQVRSPGTRGLSVSSSCSSSFPLPSSFILDMEHLTHARGAPESDLRGCWYMPVPPLKFRVDPPASTVLLSADSAAAAIPSYQENVLSFASRELIAWSFHTSSPGQTLQKLNARIPAAPEVE
jgi:hypothetical protein